MESVKGEDIYSIEQLKIIQQLDANQICELINIDTNYIMPYVAGRKACNIIDEENIEEYKNRCKQVFEQLYGKEKMKELEVCIDMIFDAQISYQKSSEMIDANGNIIRQNRIPLESLKLLFNKNIIESNSLDLIKEYYSKLFSEENEKENFEQIILNTYGENAISILNSRKELDVYSINSLEIFDQRILNNFSEEFVHDLLSYNIRNFSSLLNIVKNEEELKLFKKYYELLSKTIGKNVEVMQKAISEFYYVSDLLKNIEGEELTEKQQINLIACLCWRKNKFDIENIEDLERFDEIANDKYEQEMAIAVYITGVDSYVVKDVICDNIFGIKCWEIDEVFDIFVDYANEFTMSEEEKTIFECLKLIVNETDYKKLQEMGRELISKQGIRNPIYLYSLIAKIKEKGIEYLKRRMLTKQKLDCICEEENGEIRKETVDGIEIYYFEGFSLADRDLGFLGHDASNACGRDFMEDESQLGMSTVSTKFIDDRDLMQYFYGCKIAPEYLFAEIESENLLAYEKHDANVSHAPKLVRSSHKRFLKGGMKEGKITRKLEGGCNEVAFYRRIRNHDKRDKQRNDGRIKISYIVVFSYDKNRSSVDDIPKEKIEYAKKYQIPIIVFNQQRYQEKQKKYILNNGGDER